MKRLDTLIAQLQHPKTSQDVRDEIHLLLNVFQPKAYQSCLAETLRRRTLGRSRAPCESPNLGQRWIAARSPLEARLSAVKSGAGRSSRGRNRS
jgi:hypothetical protein